MEETWDCIVVGGGAAGLSAALVLGRARQRTLVIDAGNQSNRPAAGIGGLLGHDGRPPADLYGAGRAELARYPSVEVRVSEVRHGSRQEGYFELELADGTRETTRRVLLATGMHYRRSTLPGVAERWGRSVFHCPFCHGWEVRDRTLAVLDPGETGVLRALLLREWSDDVTLLTDGPATIAADALATLRTAGVEVDERPVERLRGAGTALSAVVFADGRERHCDGLLVAITLHQPSALATELGVELAEPTPMAFDPVQVDPMYATNVPGVYAAGDSTGTMPSVANSIAAGSSAAARIVHDVVFERHGLGAS